MKKVLALMLLACIGVMADPVSCGMLEEGRAVDKAGCRCAVKNDVIDTVKFRYIVGACAKGQFSSEVLDFWINGHWAKVTFEMCEALPSVKKFSCKKYNYMKENYNDEAELMSKSYTDRMDKLRELLDPGDVDYLFSKQFQY